MTSGEPVKSDTGELLAEDGSARPVPAGTDATPDVAESPVSGTSEAESREDDAWIDACRQELDNDNTADSTDPTDRAEAIEKTGDDAMSKFGHALGALAESDEDLEDRAFDEVAEMASPSRARDEAVAPHIAAAERELERSRSSGPVDIFDRIAQAAESQFDDSRGSTTRRVSELVDDRRVGTKKWTPSKTMKQRMEKLEAARSAASAAAPTTTAAGVRPAVAAKPDLAPVEDAVETAEPQVAAAAASAPSSSTATMVSPDAAKKEPVEKVEPAPMTEEQKVTISRRDRHAGSDDDTATDSADATEAPADEEELDQDGLRVVPGARGRRRDRARKSRLDEDFEKIFDDEGKPSINSLRRKLRNTAAQEAEAEAAAAQPAPAAKTEEQFGATDAAATPKKPGLFAKFLKPKAAKPAPAPVADEDELVAAFEADSSGDMGDSLYVDDIGDDDGAGDDWQTAVSSERKQRQVIVPVIAGGAMIALGGLGFIAYRFLFG